MVCTWLMSKGKLVRQKDDFERHFSFKLRWEAYSKTGASKKLNNIVSARITWVSAALTLFIHCYSDKIKVDMNSSVGREEARGVLNEVL